METIIIADYKVTTYRKHNTKLVLSLRDRAIELLPQGKSLKEIHNELDVMLKSNKKNINTYLCYWGISEWKAKEYLSIRDCSIDCTYVSISLNDNEDEISGICRECGCSWENPCMHPDHGPCSWVDENETICSHCANLDIKNSSETEHCVNTAGKYFCYKTTDYVVKTSMERDLCKIADVFSNSIIGDIEAFKIYIEERIKELNKNNGRCKPARIWNWDINKSGEIRCVLSSASYKVELCFYPVKKIIA